VQVNSRIGLTFSTILRTALRQDPDIVLVGEMRDQETAEIGLRAAMTGHLVFSTLHTQSAVSTVSRLLDMGAQGYLIASALDGVLAQRLVRRICDNCAQPAKPTVQQQSWLSSYLSAAEVESAKFSEGVGCTYCNMTGYRGRVGIYELLEVDAAIAAAIRHNDLNEVERLAARAPGFIPLVRRAIEYALDGTTSVAEIMTSLAGLEEPVRRESLLDDVLSSAGTPAAPPARLTS
jgi:MSHA biogenesis protein MshE